MHRTRNPLSIVRSSRLAILGLLLVTAWPYAHAVGFGFTWDDAQPRRLHLTLTWLSLSAAQPHDTIFVHLGLANQPPIAQNDDDGWNTFAIRHLSQ
jgi:hypothetical protein